MSGDFESLCGITKDELLSTFEEPIQELADKYKITFDEAVERLKKKYDGYHFGEEMIDIFNPFSILNCLKSKRMHNFWFASGTTSYLVRLLAHSNENINELVGKYYDAKQFIDYKADVEKPLPMIYQSGYLTIKDYTATLIPYLLYFRKEEVHKVFVDALASYYFSESAQPKSWVNDVTDALEAGDTTKLCQCHHKDGCPMEEGAEDDENMPVAVIIDVLAVVGKEIYSRGIC